MCFPVGGGEVSEETPRTGADYEDRSDTEATAFLPEMDDEYPDLPGALDVPPLPAEPPPMPVDPLERPHTREHFAISTVTEDDERPARQSISNERIRQPAPRRKRPTMAQDGRVRPLVNRVNDSVMQPIRARHDGLRPDLAGGNREASDVVKTFDSHELDARPEPMTSAVSQLKPQTGGQARNRRALVRKANTARRAPQPRRQPQRPQPRSPAPSPAAMQQHVLPLSPESLSMLIAEQRRRLHVLDGLARGLEICAGVLGTVSLAVLIAALVSILVGSDVSVLNASSALVSSAAALGLTLLMVVGSVAMRQLAHVSAQLAALLEALANRR